MASRHCDQSKRSVAILLKVAVVASPATSSEGQGQLIEAAIWLGEMGSKPFEAKTSY
jgi:hypothetical protein